MPVLWHVLKFMLARWLVLFLVGTRLGVGILGLAGGVLGVLFLAHRQPELFSLLYYATAGFFRVPPA